MKHTAITLGVALLLMAASSVRSADAPPLATIDVWPGQAPGDDGSIGAEKVVLKKDGSGPQSITNVTRPTITVYRPEKSKSTGAAVLVFPGGGYNNLAWDHEGDQVGKWLNSIGITGFVVKYRVPRRTSDPKDQPPRQALMDAQRALSVIRSKAADWEIDPKRVGVLGFSAGGHLAAWISTNDDHRAYESIDAADKSSCRPDFAVLIYPGGITKSTPGELAPEIRVTSNTPPMFFAHAGDDRVSPENSVHLYLALKRAGVPSELHIYASGGHGFGLRPSPNPSSTWPNRCEEWLKARGVLKAIAAP